MGAMAEPEADPALLYGSYGYGAYPYAYGAYSPYGYSAYTPYRYYGKRSADAEPEADAALHAALNTGPMSLALLLAPGENLLDSPSKRASMKIVQQQSPLTSSDVSFWKILEGETVRSSMSSPC